MDIKKMHDGSIYLPTEKEIDIVQSKCLDALADFNLTKRTEMDKRIKYMKETFASCGDNVYFEPPFHANFGGHHLHVGNNVYANFNFTCVDDTYIYIEDNVMIGPNVTLCTAGHPIRPDLRLQQYQFNMPVRICKNAWLGAGVIVLPGVTVGENSVIGAGSVVTKDIPANVVAYGNPCRVVREINEHDKEYYYKDRKIEGNIK